MSGAGELRCVGCGETAGPGDLFCEQCGRRLDADPEPVGSALEAAEGARSELDIGVAGAVSDRGRVRTRSCVGVRVEGGAGLSASAQAGPGGLSFTGRAGVLGGWGGAPQPTQAGSCAPRAGRGFAAGAFRLVPARAERWRFGSCTRACSPEPNHPGLKITPSLLRRAT